MVDRRLKPLVKIESKINDEESERGNGFFISPNLIITARHVVSDNLDSVENIKVSIPFSDCDEEIIELLEVVDHDIELDVCILKTRTEFSTGYLEFASFPLYSETYSIKVPYLAVGYRKNKWDEVIWPYGVIHNPVLNQKWNLALSTQGNYDPNISWSGFSGSPMFVGDKVYGVVIYQCDSQTNIPLGAVSTVKLFDFLRSNGIYINEYLNHETIELEGYKNKLLEVAFNEIEQRKVNNKTVKLFIQVNAKQIIQRFADWNVKEFEAFINSIKTPFDNPFKLDNTYLKHTNIIADIIIQLVIITKSLAGANFDIRPRGQAVNQGDKYIAYLYSAARESYDSTVLNLFTDLNDEPLDRFDRLATILIGSKAGKCSNYCNAPYDGAVVDMSNIIQDYTDIYDIGSPEELTKLKTTLFNIKFHCENCLEYDNAKSISHMKNKVSSVLED